MLSNATDPLSFTETYPGFTHILRQLSPTDARVLDRLFQAYLTDPERSALSPEEIMTPVSLKRKEFEVVTDNLIRLGLCEVGGYLFGDTVLKVADKKKIAMTDFGTQFCIACNPPTKVIS